MFEYKRCSSYKLSIALFTFKSLFFRVNREGMPDSFSRFIVVGSLNPFFTTLLLLQHSHFVGLYDRTPLNIKCVYPFIFSFLKVGSNIIFLSFICSNSVIQLFMTNVLS